jgi:hypothetical protein
MDSNPESMVRVIRLASRTNARGDDYFAFHFGLALGMSVPYHVNQMGSRKIAQNVAQSI